MDFLDFEQPIVELERRIEELKLTISDSESSVDIDNEINNLNKKCETLTNKIFSNLTEWQVVQLSRHPKRPISSEDSESEMVSLSSSIFLSSSTMGCSKSKKSMM